MEAVSPFPRCDVVSGWFLRCRCRCRVQFGRASCTARDWLATLGDPYRSSIVDAAGTPVEGAILAFQRMHPVPTTLMESVTTDADGRFELGVRRGLARELELPRHDVPEHGRSAGEVGRAERAGRSG